MPDTHSSPSQEMSCESASSLFNSLTWEEVHGQPVLRSLPKDPSRDITAWYVSHLPNTHPSGQLSANLHDNTVSSQEISKLCDVPYGALAGGDHPGRNPQGVQNIQIPAGKNSFQQEHQPSQPVPVAIPHLLNLEQPRAPAVLCSTSQPIPDSEVELLMPEVPPFLPDKAPWSDTSSANMECPKKLSPQTHSLPDKASWSDTSSASMECPKKLSPQTDHKLSSQQSGMKLSPDSDKKLSTQSARLRSPRLVLKPLPAQPSKQHQPAQSYQPYPSRDIRQPSAGLSLKQQSAQLSRKKLSAQPFAKQLSAQPSCRTTSAQSHQQQLSSRQQIRDKQLSAQACQKQLSAKPCQLSSRQQIRDTQLSAQACQKQLSAKPCQQHFADKPNSKLQCKVCSIVPGDMSNLFHDCPAPHDCVAVPAPGTHHVRTTQPRPTSPLPLQSLLLEGATQDRNKEMQAILLEGATADMNGAIQLLTGASQNPKLSDADITVLSKVAAEMHSANSIIRSHLHLVQQQDFSGVSQQGPPPVPSWMSTFLQSDSRTIAPACSNGSLQTPLASHPTQSDAAALGLTPLVQVTQALPQHAVYT